MLRKVLLISAIVLLCLVFLALLPFSYKYFLGVSVGLLTLLSGTKLSDKHIGNFLTQAGIPTLGIILIGFALGIGIFKLVKMLQNESTKLNPKSVAASALAFFGIGWLIVPSPLMVVATIFMGLPRSLNPGFNTEWSLSNLYILFSYMLFLAVGPSILMLFPSLQYWKPRMSSELRIITACCLALAAGVWLIGALLFLIWDFASLPRHLMNSSLNTTEFITFLMQISLYVLLFIGMPLGIFRYAYRLFRFKTSAEIERQAELEAVYKLED